MDTFTSSEDIFVKTMPFLHSGLKGTRGLALSSGVQVTVTPAGKLDRAECWCHVVAKIPVAVLFDMWEGRKEMETLGEEV